MIIVYRMLYSKIIDLRKFLKWCLERLGQFMHFYCHPFKLLALVN